MAKKRGERASGASATAVVAILLASVAIATGIFVSNSAATTGVGAGRTLTWVHPGNQEAWKACPRPFYPTHAALPGFGEGRRLVMLGDSLTRSSYTALQRQFTQTGWRPTIICWGGNQTNWGLQQLHDLRAQVGKVPDTVVVAMGTNDVHKNVCRTRAACAKVQKAFRQRVRATLNYLGPHRHIVWVNIHIRLTNALRFFAQLGAPEPQLRHYPAFNRILAQEVAADSAGASGIRQVIDWDRVVRRYNKTNRQPLPMTADGLHYTDLGGRLRGALIQAALRRVQA